MTTKRPVIRTCVGCRSRLPREELLRFGVDRTGRVRLDLEGMLGGRGVYTCGKSECVARACRVGALGRGLRRPKGRCDAGLSRLADRVRDELVSGEQVLLGRLCSDGRARPAKGTPREGAGMLAMDSRRGAVVICQPRAAQRVQRLAAWQQAFTSANERDHSKGAKER